MNEGDGGLRLPATGHADGTAGGPAPDASGPSVQESPGGRRAAEMAALFDGNAVGVAAGEGGAVLEANDEVLRILQLPRSALADGLAWPDFAGAGHLERDAVVLRRLQADGSAVLHEDLTRPDGSRIPVLVALAVHDWQPFRWVAVVVDLTREERLRELADSESAIVSTLLEDAPIGFAFIDPQLRFVRINRELAAMNGFSVAEHEGAPVFELLPGLRETAEPLLREVLETGRPLRDVEIIGTTAADPDRQHTWLESFFPVRVPGGPIAGVAAIARDVTDLRRLEAELETTLRRQRDALQQLQAALLPQLPEVTGVELAAQYLGAADEVLLGGDWFEALVAPDGRLALFVGDAVGHGLTAVGLMARASGAVHALVRYGHGPAELLAQLNELLLSDHLPGLVTATAAFLDLAGGELEYATGGHPPPLVLPPRGPATLLDGAQGVFLGAEPGSRFRSGRTRLHEGATLVLYTDGLVERRGEHLDDGLRRLLGAAGGAGRPGARSASAVLTAVVAGCLGDRARTDDVCVLAATRTRGGAGTGAGAATTRGSSP